jgi:hypothetical protein
VVDKVVVEMVDSQVNKDIIHKTMELQTVAVAAVEVEDSLVLGLDMAALESLSFHTNK